MTEVDANTEHRARRVVVRHGAILTGARTLPVVALYIASFQMSPGGFGQLAILVTAMNVALLIADSGMDASATWLVSRTEEREQKQKYLSSLRVARTTLGASAAIIFAVPSCFALDIDPFSTLGIASMAVVFASWSSLNGARRIEARLSGSGEYRSLLAEKCIHGAIFLVLALVLNSGPGELFFGYLAAMGAGCLAGTLSLGKGGARTGDRRTLVALLTRSAPFILSALSASIAWRLSVHVLAFSSGTAHAGYFTLAYYPIQFISSVPVLGAAMVLVAGRFDIGEMRRLAFTSVRLGAGAFAVLASVTIAATFSGQQILAKEVLWTLLILSAALPFLWANPVLSAAIRASGQAWSPTFVHILGAVVAAGSVFPLAYGLGSEGAAIAAVAAEFVVFLGLFIVFARQYRRA